MTKSAIGNRQSAIPISSAVVLGGGLAGIAAAVRLAEHGVKVTLVETSKRLGGRATSFVDRQTGEHIDNCQHVLLGCCTNLIDLYQRLGVSGRITWDKQLHFFDKQGHHDVLQRGPLPAPLHLSGSLLRFGSLHWREKVAIACGMWTILWADRHKWADRSFTDWLKEHGQSERAVERFWSTIVISACNQTPGLLSAAYAMQVFQDGFLAHRDAYVMGVANVPLVQLYDPAATAIKSRGGKVLLGTSVEAILFDPGAPGQVSGVKIDSGPTLQADVYVSALPFDRLSKTADDRLRAADARLSRLDELEVSPIIGIHLWFDRQVTELPHMIFVDSPLQWIFNKHWDPENSAHHVHGVISAAHEWIDRSGDEIAQMAHDELARYLPHLDDAKLVRSRVVKEKHATFSASPGVDALRPATTGPVKNLLLAGDWTHTGWPATMEGAVRSGYLAAGAAVGRQLLVPDLK